MDPMTFYQAGGWPMHLILLFGISAAALSVLLTILAYALGSRRWATFFLVVLALAGLAAFLLGVMGQVIGVHDLARVLSTVAPEDRDVIATMTAAEARTCLAFGLFAAILPWMAAAIVLGRAAAARVSVRAVMGGVVLAAAVCTLVGGLALHEVATVERDRSAALIDPSQRSALLQAGDAAARARLVWGLGMGGGLAAAGVALVAAGTARGREDQT